MKSETLRFFRMPRKAHIVKREIVPDPMYQSTLVSKFVIEDVFGGALFPAPHHAVDEFRHQRALVHGVWHDFPLDDMRFPGHKKNLTIPNFRSRNSKSKFPIELDLPGPPARACAGLSGKHSVIL